jgi:hypothetical protein
LAFVIRKDPFARRLRALSGACARKRPSGVNHSPGEPAN